MRVQAMRVRKYSLPLLILAAGLIVFVWFQVTAQAPEPLRPKSRAPAVSVQVVEKTTAAPTLRIFGQVETPSMSVLTAGVEADVVAVKALEGNAVARGQEMIVLDDTDAALEVLQRRAELAEIEAMMASDRIRLQADQAALKTEESLLALLRKSVRRAAQLARSQAGTEAALDQARQDEQRQQLAITQRRQAIDDFASRQQQLQARREKAAAALQRAERDHQRTRVTAPFDGRITQVMVSPGDRAKRDSRLIQLYDESRLELRAQVPGAAVPALRRALDANQPVTAVALTASNSSANARAIQLVLHRLSANVAEGQGGIDAFFRAPASGGEGGARLPVPGGTLEVRLQLPPIEDVVVLSADSLYGSNRVYRVRDERLQSHPVRRLGQLIDANGRHMLIVAGDAFEAGDEVLNSRLPQAVNGLQVRVMPR